MIISEITINSREHDNTNGILLCEVVKFYCPKSDWATEKNAQINETMEKPNGNSGDSGAPRHSIQVVAAATATTIITISNEMMEWPI